MSEINAKQIELSINKALERENEILPESAIIVTLVHHYKEFPAFASVLKTEHFDIKANKMLFDLMFALFQNDESWDIVTISQALDTNLKRYLYKIATNPNNDQMPYLALKSAYKIVSQKNQNFKKRRLETFAKELTDENSDIIASELIDLFNNNETQSQEHINEILPSYIEWLMSPKDLLTTQFPKLDKANGGGWEKGAVHTIAARPGQGKTALMISLVNHDLEQGRKVGVITLEMNNNKIVTRTISNKARIDNHKIKNFDLNIEEQQRFQEAYSEIENSNLYICEDSSMNAIQIYNKINLWKLNYDIEIVYIDHLGYIDHDYNKGETQTIGIHKTMKRIVSAAKKTNIPVILFAQAGRDADTKSDVTRFTLRDLDDSKAIEQFSHTVIFLVRPETYGETYYKIDENNQISTKGLGIFVIAKSRDGYLGIILTTYINYATLFLPYKETRKEYSHEPEPELNNYSRLTF